MGDKGEGGVKNLKKWVTSFMDSPKYSSQLCSTILKYNVHIASPPHSTKLVRRLYMLERFGTRTLLLENIMNSIKAARQKYLVKYNGCCARNGTTACLSFWLLAHFNYFIERN